MEDEEGEDKFIVQFAILKKNNNETEMPYEQNDFIDAESIVTRMKAMGHLDKIADLDVDDIEFVSPFIFSWYCPRATVWARLSRVNISIVLRL